MVTPRSPHVPDEREQADAALAALLKELREQRGITQEELAFDAGITVSTLSRIERALNSPGWATVMQITRALGVTVGELGAGLERAGAEVAQRRVGPEFRVARRPYDSGVPSTQIHRK